MARPWILTSLILAGCAGTVATTSTKPPPRAKVSGTPTPYPAAKTPAPTLGFLHSSPAPGTPRPTATPAPTPTPTPTPIVVHDDRAALDGQWGFTGRLTKGGAPLAGRTVVLYHAVQFPKEDELARATTDADGRYVLPVPAAEQKEGSKFAVAYNRTDTATIDASHAAPGGEGEYRAACSDEHLLDQAPNHQEQVDFDLAWDATNVPITPSATVAGPKVSFKYPRKVFSSLGLVVWQGKDFTAGQRVCDSVQGTGGATWDPSCTGKPDGTGLPPGDYQYHLSYFDYDQKATKGAYLAYGTPWIPFTVK